MLKGNEGKLENYYIIRNSNYYLLYSGKNNRKRFIDGQPWQSDVNNLLSNAAKDETNDEHAGDDDHHNEAQEQAAVGGVAVGVDHNVTREVIIFVCCWESGNDIILIIAGVEYEKN